MFAALIFVLANPLIVNETHSPLPDVAAIVIDRSQSMGVDDRKAQEDAALAAIKKQLAGDKALEIRESVVTTTATGEDNGTQLFAGLNAALADVPPERIAGAILITDGEVHDAPAPDKLAVHAPIHALIAGRRGEKDRKLTIVNAARFAIVGQSAPMVVRVDDSAPAAAGWPGSCCASTGRRWERRPCRWGTTRRCRSRSAMAARTSWRSKPNPAPRN